MFKHFWSKVAPTTTPSECWQWQGSLDRDGYGVFHIRANGGQRIVRAHRISYRMWIGPIPSWLQVDHLCRNRACQKIEHMELVTGKVNIQRGKTGQWVRQRQLCLPLQWPRHGPTPKIRALAAAGRVRKRAHCTAGHPLSGDNLIVRSDNGGRRCKTCQYERVRAWKRRRAVAGQ